MAKYEFDLSVGIQEVLDADSAKKVESQIEKQKQKFEEPIELKLSVSDAKKRLQELEKEARKIQRALTKATSAQNFSDIAKHTRVLANIQKEQEELSLIIGKQVDSIVQQVDATKAAEAAEKRRKRTVDKTRAAAQDMIDVLIEQAELFERVAEAEEKINKSQKTRKDASVKKEVEVTKELVGATDQVAKAQDKAAKTTLRTAKQINAELDKEKQKLQEIEAQQKRNDAARESFKRKQANYGKEVLGVDHAVYDTDLLKGAAKELKEFNEMLETRNKFQEKYMKLCQIIEKYYIDDKPGKYSIGNGVYKNLDTFFEMNADIRWLEQLSEKGQKNTNKAINEVFKNIVRDLQADGSMVSSMISSGEVSGDLIGQELDREETQLNREMQRLMDEREAQLARINALRQEELDLIKKVGQEEKNNSKKLKFTDGTLLNETQIKAVEKYCSILKKSMGEAYNEARELKAALDLVFNIKEGNVANLMDRFTAGNKASNAALQIMTGMTVNNQTNRDAALRSINPDIYDKIVADQKAAAEKTKLELKSQKSDFEKQWDEFVFTMLGGDAFKDESNLVKGKILKAFGSYGKTAKEAIEEVNKAWLKGELDGKGFKSQWVQRYVDHLNSLKEYYDELRNITAEDLDIDSLFGLGGTAVLGEGKAQALRDEAAAWDELIAKKKEYYGIANEQQSKNTKDQVVETQKQNQLLDEQAQKEKQLAEATEKQKERLHEIYEIAKKNQNRDYQKDYPKGTDALSQRIGELQTLVPQLKELQTEVSQMGVAANDENFNAAFAAAGVLSEAITNKGKDLEYYNTRLEETIKLEEFAAKASEKYGISIRSKKFGADVMAQFKELVFGLQNGLSVDDAMGQLDAVMEKNGFITQEIEKQVDAEGRLTDATRKTKDVLTDVNSAAISMEEIVARDINKALEQLRSAKNNETTLFSLKGVFEGEDLVTQAQNMIENIASKANLSLGKFEAFDNDGLIKVQLYNDELKVAVDQTYKLVAATEEMESAQLQLIKTHYSQNVKALNANPFDSDSAQKSALSSLEKLRADAERAKYDLSELEQQAKAISSTNDVTKFNNELKVAQNEIQAIKNSTATKSSMNPLINMQRDMKVANTELDTMRLKLEKLGDVSGIEEANRIIAEMTTALNEYNQATTSEGQQKAYNQYSDLRHSFKAQMEYINAAKALNDQQTSTQKQTDPIREQYQSILDLVNKINDVSSNITKYQAKDGGSGIFAGYIGQLQSEKAKLVSELQGITDTINNTLSGGFIQGKEYSVPFASILDGSGAISGFLNDTRTQASLTTDEIEKLVVALQKSQNIDVEAAAKVAEQFKPVQETYKRLAELTTLDKSNANYQALFNIFGQIAQYKQQLSSDSTEWSPAESAYLQQLIDQFTKYGNALAQAGEKEARYFAGKQKYASGQTMGDMNKDLESTESAYNRLAQAAQEFANNKAMITGFSETADGISRLNFSVFDAGAKQLRNFTFELGSVTEGIHKSETTITKSLSNIQAAQKQLQSAGNLLGKLDASGVSVGEGTAPAQVQKVLALYQQLSAEIAKGDGADQNRITKLTNDLKLASSETEKLYKNMIKMDGVLESGQAINLGKGNANGDVYSQLTNAAQQLIGTQQGVTLEFGNFDAATNTLNASMTHVNGTVESVKLQMDQLSGQMTAQRTGVGKLTNSWDTFKAGLAKAGKQLMMAVVGYNVFFKAISAVRKGIGYVKEIDLAMTELKKVTDESAASYKEFLNTAADTAGRIGSTVADFTEATANFARLGYTMEESAKMAETAVVYKNVADGINSVEEATDSIISTMKAFGIESSNTMQIIDIFNEVKVSCLHIW